MANPTGWKPSMERVSGEAEGVSAVGAGGATRGLALEEPLVFEHGSRGRTGVSLPAPGGDFDPARELPKGLLRGEVEGLPELSELEIVRHFTRLSQWNWGIDSGFYPLGSCTMKYNPKSSEALARLPGFAAAHPLLPAAMCQGMLELMFKLERALSEIAGFAATTLSPAAGAHGELCGLMMIRAYHVSRGSPRKKVLIPDTAHGTNPASASLNGYASVPLASGPDGRLHPETVKAAMDEDVAAIMITNPNTLGIFESHIAEIAEIVHGKGGLVYGDGANLNALLGVVRPGDVGFDVMQFNLHKTFATPHGGGGPGSGPVAVKEALVPFLPLPRRGEGGRDLPAGHRSEGAPAHHRQAARIPGQRRHVRPRLGAHPGARARGAPAHGRAGGAERQLRPGAPPGRLPPALRDRLAARGRLQRQARRRTPASPPWTSPSGSSTTASTRPPSTSRWWCTGALMIEPTETESKETIDQFVGGHARHRRGGEARRRRGEGRAREAGPRPPRRDPRRPQARPPLEAGHEGGVAAGLSRPTPARAAARRRPPPERARSGPRRAAGTGAT